MIAEPAARSHAGVRRRRILSLLLMALVPGAAWAQAPVQGEPWRHHLIDETAQGARSLYLRDVNGNNRPDVAVALEEIGEVRLYFHPGYLEQRQPWPQVTVGTVPEARDAVVVDLDRDGAFDVISAGGAEQPGIFLHWGPREPERYGDSEAWTTEILPASVGRRQWTHVRAVHLTGRDGVDLLAAAEGSDALLGWFEAPRNARALEQWTWRPLRTVRRVSVLSTQDLNDSRLPDVIFAEPEGQMRGVWWLRHPGLDRLRQPWQAHGLGGQRHTVTALATGDLDGDGQPDFVAATAGGPVLRFGPAPQAQQRVGEQRWLEREIRPPADAGAGTGIAMGDLTGDGRQDIVLSAEADAGEHGVFLLNYHMGHTWQGLSISGSGSARYAAVQLADLSGNGALDIITAEAEAGLIWYENPHLPPFADPADMEGEDAEEAPAIAPLHLRPFERQ